MSVGECLVLSLRELPKWFAARGIRGRGGKPLSRDCLYGWVKDGRLKPITTLPILYFRVSDLEKLLAPEPESEPERTRHRTTARRNQEWQKQQDAAEEILRKYGAN